MRRREARHEVGAKRQRSSHALKAGREASDEATQTHTQRSHAHIHTDGGYTLGTFASDQRQVRSIARSLDSPVRLSPNSSFVSD